MTTSTQERTPFAPPTPSQGQSSILVDPVSDLASLPPPQTFDILPPLHDILTRLLSSPSVSTSAAALQQQANGAAKYLEQEDTSLNTQSGIYGGTYQLPLEIQHLSTEVSSVRNRMRTARAAVERLPDMDRSVEEQEQDIKELRSKIEKQREMLNRLGR